MYWFRSFLCISLVITASNLVFLTEENKELPKGACGGPTCLCLNIVFLSLWLCIRVLRRTPWTLRLECRNCHFPQSSTLKSRPLFYFIKLTLEVSRLFFHPKKVLRPSLFNCCLLPLPLLLRFFFFWLILFLNLCAIPTPFLFSAPKLFSLEDAICFCLSYHLQLFNIVTCNFFLMPTFLFQEISNSNMLL